MVNGYLAFARGEMPEIEQTTELPAMLLRIARDTAPDKNIETNFPDEPAQFYARPMALARAFGNIIENAARYARTTIRITEHDSADQVEVIIEDDARAYRMIKSATHCDHLYDWTTHAARRLAEQDWGCQLHKQQLKIMAVNCSWKIVNWADYGSE